MLFDPKIKPRLWNLKSGIVAHNCARMKLPVPVLAMPFWERTGKIFDHSGSGIFGILTGGPVWSDGGIYFDGNNDYINCGSPEALKITGNLTYSCRIKFTASQADRIFMIYYTFSNPWDGVVLGIGSDTETNKIKWHGDDHTKDAEGTTALNDGTWHHIVGTYDGDKFRLYVDGVYDAISVSDTISYTATSAFNIGAWKDGQQHFNGTIRIPIVFDQALNANQVRTLYNNSYGMFEPIRDYRIWSFITGGETFYKSIVGNQPASTGNVVTIGIYKQTIVGNMPTTIASIVKKISTLITGDIPAPTAIILKKTSKQFVGEQPATTGNVTAVSVYKQTATGNVPATTGSLDSIFQIGQTITGNMPTCLGNVIKRIGKILAGSQPATIGNITKQTKKNVAGDMPPITGSVSHATKTFLSGIMGSITGIVSKILNPIPPLTVKLCKLIGSCFKKFLG